MIDASSPHYSRIERGLYRISGDQVRALATKLGVSDADGIEEVVRAAEQPTGTGWWSPYASRLAQNYLDFIELESMATSLRMVHPVIIPGPLQSTGYIREIITRSLASDSRDRAEMLVNVRLARQEILTRTDHPVSLHALLPQSAFHAHFEQGPNLMRDQLRRLIDLAEMPNVTIQIIPPTAHPTFGATGAITLMGFRNPWAPVASVDNAMGGHHTEDPEQVAYMEREFENILPVALSADRTREVLTEYLEGLHT